MTEERYWALLAKKLAEELSPEEEAEWAQLCLLFPDLHYSARSIGQLWERPSEPSPAAAQALERHLKRMEADGIEVVDDKVLRKRRILHWLVVPAVALVTIATLLVLRDIYTPAEVAARQSEVSTRPGSRSRVVLPDSTVVWLNAGSRLTYAEGFGVTHRHTELTGEAFFDVTHNEALPFTIKAGEVRIKVLGTAFNVKAYPGEATETSLLRGHVQLTLAKRPGETYQVRPNEKLVLSAPSDTVEGHPLVVLRSLEHTADKGVMETAWIDNKLVFRNEPLSQLAARMTRWYGTPVTVYDEALGKERVSGVFSNEPLAQALTELQLIVHFHKVPHEGGFLLIPLND
ncbi:FecR family protein [Flaviaesturariibacter terrae]